MTDQNITLPKTVRFQEPEMIPNNQGSFNPPRQNIARVRPPIDMMQPTNIPQQMPQIDQLLKLSPAQIQQLLQLQQSGLPNLQDPNLDKSLVAVDPTTITIFGNSFQKKYFYIFLGIIFLIIVYFLWKWYTNKNNKNDDDIESDDEEEGNYPVNYMGGPPNPSQIPPHIQQQLYQQQMMQQQMMQQQMKNKQNIKEENVKPEEDNEE